MRRALPLLTALICARSATPCWCQDTDSTQRREDQLRAGYLFNVAKFVNWPATTPADALLVCLVGANGIQDRRRFRVNLQNAQRVGLHISSKLLLSASSAERGGSR